MHHETPLGKQAGSPEEYAPDVLCPIPRHEGRVRLGIRGAPPFRGEDLWNAWELTWLDPRGRPRVATALIRVPADSLNLLESKSLKLYLNSLAMTRFASSDEIAALLAADLSEVAGSDVSVGLKPPAEPEAGQFAGLPGTCIDDVEVTCNTYEVDSSLLRTTGEGITAESLHSHLLRSNCPVTGQPDMGSVAIRYRGPRIDPAALLRYLVSYRRHCAFHESCVERMFLDIKARCAPEQLSVYARYQRRGGIDINPFRSDFDLTAGNLRLWRQ